LKNKIVITGGSGFIGTNLVKYLAKTDYKIIIVDTVQPKIKADIVQWLQGEVYDQNVIQQLHSISDEIYCLFHLASSVGVTNILENSTEFIRNNMKIIEVFLPFLADINVPVIFTSTSEIYDETGYVKRFNTSSFRESYAISKLYIENCLYSTLSNVVVLRLFNIVGTNQDSEKGVFAKMLSNILNNKSCTLYCNENNEFATRYFTSIDDLVEIFKLLLQDASQEKQYFCVKKPFDVIAVQNMLSVKNMFEKIKNKFSNYSLAPNICALQQDELLHRLVPKNNNIFNIKYTDFDDILESMVKTNEK